MNNKTSPIANLHTPDELLENAEVMLASKNPKMFRGAILEAITALEAYVQEIIFATLETKLDSLLVTWLEEKTRMDFDTRLSILTPIATGISIDKQTALWQDYKTAKEIRNKVTHSGKKVTEEEARRVVDIVYKWLAYLGKTAALELELLKFKQYIESNKIRVGTMDESIALITNYFGRSTAAQAAANVIVKDGLRHYGTDVILKFGDEVAIVETKILRNFNPEIIELARRQVENLKYAYISSERRKKSTLPRVNSVVIIFADDNVPESYNSVVKFGEYLYLVVVKSKSA